MIFYARGIFIKWNYEPTIVQVIRLKNIREVPLPAMTICSPLMAKYDFASFGEFLKLQMNNESVEKFSTEEQKKLAALSQACFMRKYNDDPWNFDEYPVDTVKYLEQGKSLTVRFLSQVRVKYVFLCK